MPTEPKTLGSPSLDTLKDGCYAVKQVLKALPKVGLASTSPEVTRLSRPIATKLKLSERLTEVLELVGKAPRGNTCDAIRGIIEDGKSIMEGFWDNPALDAGLVDTAQGRRVLRDGVSLGSTA